MKWKPKIGDLLIHEKHGIGYVVEINTRYQYCIIRWNNYLGKDDTCTHYYNQINWCGGPMKLYPVKL